mmetsp:Transcript_108/g.183  ORF Transcript_108/g.183 Transcript_108/m.183 type:complete len:227 (-) Transcript_108:226-906(-)
MSAGTQSWQPSKPRNEPPTIEKKHRHHGVPRKTEREKLGLRLPVPKDTLQSVRRSAKRIETRDGGDRRVEEDDRPDLSEHFRGEILRPSRAASDIDSRDGSIPNSGEEGVWWRAMGTDGGDCGDGRGRCGTRRDHLVGRNQWRSVLAASREQILMACLFQTFMRMAGNGPEGHGGCVRAKLLGLLDRPGRWASARTSRKREKVLLAGFGRGCGGGAVWRRWTLRGS